MNKINKKQHERIVNLNNNGLSSGKIGEKLNLSKTRICQILLANNIDSRANRREKKLNHNQLKY
jgi:orotate phosphoribosyltransferase-like protein